MKTSIIVHTETEFVHCWPEAPEEVEYLKYPHRHMLHVELKIEVFNEDRELEFIMVKHRLTDFLRGFLSVAKMRTSCEQVALAIRQWTLNEYGFDREVVVRVFEDNENGVEVTA